MKKWKIDYIYYGTNDTLYYDFVLIKTKRTSPIVPFNEFIKLHNIDLYSILQVQEA